VGALFLETPMLCSPRALLFASAFVAALLARAAEAENLPTRPILTLDAARSIASAAEAKAQAEGWPCVIAVTDGDGLPILLERMDDAAVPGGVDLAPGKARTAALFRRPSGALEDAINSKRPAALSARGFVLMRGGEPISVGGQVIGAIGVSADTPEHDEVIAKAGLAALTP
jgi:glc operon protein GlcG